MHLFSLLPFLLALSALRANPVVRDPVSKTYDVDQVMTIEWTPSGTDSLVTIDLVNDRPEVLLQPYAIATGVQQRQGSFSWKIPRQLKSSVGYHVRVYDQDRMPKEGQQGYGAPFSIMNAYPMQQSTLTLLEPSGTADGSSLESTCLVGEQCLIRWDYPDWAESAVPRFVDIKLHSADRSEPVLTIAVSVSTGQKSYAWTVPNHDSMILERAYVAIAPSGQRVPGPGVSLYNAASGFPFRLETRAGRDARHDASTTRIDFLAPGPILTASQGDATGTGMIDIPRPTYGGGSGRKDRPDGATSAGTATSSPVAVAVSFMFLAMSLLVMF